MLAAAAIATGICLTDALAGYGYDSRGRRDPFVPLVGVEKPGSSSGVKGISSVEDINLQGIVSGTGGKKMAVINGEIMEEGDKIDRLSVLSVSDNAVKVKIDDTEYEIKLYE